MSHVYLNGQWLPIEKAHVSVLDRGFIFGDGVYEVIPVYNRRVFALEAHLKRLDRSLAGIRLSPPLDAEQWQPIIARLVQETETDDSSIYIQITRGVAPRDHAFPANTQATVFAMAKPMTAVPEEWLSQGIKVVTHEDNRWLHCDLKTTALLANVLLRQYAVDHKAVECILIRDGFVTEGAASNIIVVHEEQLLFPPRNHLILPGITYDLVIELAKKHGIPFKEAPVTRSQLEEASELLMTSSTREIVPITEMDGKKVGAGVPGPLFRELLSLYQGLK
ncbi:MAG: D-amino acid aminotransferase [Ferrovum sp. 37-45-19]|jgi:D-alanine transaminase|nr:MAG: D-amino acid aminotransferase [Ferrovum sp. 37-45-19]OZB34119.1 MAG: D-amino acid aminotransferase [Ferrovum sp. 34-44-207]HQT81019.1 D-amino acid aminotransferase [Ferrovaceae bacterium]